MTLLDNTLSIEKQILNSEEPVFVANLKKGIVGRGASLLDLTLTSMLDTNSIQRIEEQRKIEFTKMETGIDRDCEI